MEKLKTIDISTLPVEKRDCIVCRGPYGETHIPQDDGEPPLQFREKPAMPILLSCDHSVGLDCLNMWLGAKNDFKFNNTCPYCRKVLYISEIDQRVIQVGSRIRRLQEWLSNITWSNREYRPSIITVADQMKCIDELVNTGAEIDDVYDSQLNGRFNGLAIRNWWRCTMSGHVPDFLNTIPMLIHASLMNEITENHFWPPASDDLMHQPIIYVEGRLFLGHDSKAKSISPLKARFFDTIFPGYTSLPSNHTDVFHHSMMPTQIFLKILAILQEQLITEGCTGDEWDILKLRSGTQNQQLYKRLCMYTALITSAHAAFSRIETVV